MKREIRFRAWHKLDNRLYSWREMLSTRNPNAWFTGHGNTVFLMQYTGLNDKNGMEIYEGDVLRGGIYYRYEVAWDFENGGWNIGKAASMFEIIGNIYEK